ncbi:hypothetical protein HMN09_01291700 [Mycena chlorophos]|uniref:F-box domain-containing protein n=1 Tax=Mycena chlorophos TaxID=658473 RepID=A0A8H6S1W5_MYCCL|nr:hypothetical protein HMN09_01291700 [Mycena chlorophos]
MVTLPPEILDEIASFLPHACDIARLGLASRSTHSVALPHLYRHLEIRLASAAVAPLAETLKTHPERAAACRTVRFLRPVDSQDDSGTEEPESDSALSDLVASILMLCAENGRLLAIHWAGDRDNDEGFRKPVWDAIAMNCASLQELDLYVAEGEERDEWMGLTRPVYPNLRSLRIDLPDSHEWPCGHLQNMIANHCPALEDLSLRFPLCCGPTDFTLSFTLPKLKAFEFEGDELHEHSPQNEDFLVRHPHIERLKVCFGQYLRPAATQDNALRALCIDQLSIASIDRAGEDKLAPFDLSSYGKNIVHLRLLGVPHMSQKLTRGAIHSVARTLRCLELIGEDLRSFEALLQHVGVVLAETKQLEELGITSSNVWPPPPPWTVKNLQDLLGVLSYVPTLGLRAVRFYSHAKKSEPLPPSFLEYVPHRLEYISWDVFEPAPDDVQSTLYRVEGCNVRLVPPGYGPSHSRRMDWTGESILDHLA